MKHLHYAVALLAVTSPVTAQTSHDSVSVRILVDPRIELMSAIQLLSGYSLVTDHDFPYKRDVRVYFSPYAEHPAVKLFGEMSERFFSFDRVPKAMLSLSEPPALTPRMKVSSMILLAAGGRDQFERLVAALREFAVETEFMRFFEAHRGTYDLIIEGTKDAIAPALAALEAYVGLPMAGATVVLGPLLHDGGFAASYDSAPGGAEAYAFVGPSGTAEGLPDFGGADRLEGLVAHEVAHLVINPLTAEHRQEVQRYRALYLPIEEVMRRLAYGSWETAVNEHIIHAINVRLTDRRHGEEAAEQQVERDLQRGFVHVPALVERLREYEQDRERYRTLADFYPRLLEVFAEALEQDD